MKMQVKEKIKIKILIISLDFEGYSELDESDIMLI